MVVWGKLDKWSCEDEIDSYFGVWLFGDKDVINCLAKFFFICNGRLRIFFLKKRYSMIKRFQTDAINISNAYFFS